VASRSAQLAPIADRMPWGPVLPVGWLATLPALLALLPEQAWAQSITFDELSVPTAQSFQTLHVFYVHGEQDAAAALYGPASVTFALQQEKEGPKSVQSHASYVGLQVHILPQHDVEELTESKDFCEDRTFKLKRKERSVSYSITGHSNVQKSDIKGASGAYVLIFSNCAETLTDIKVRGKVSVRNPHGYLPAVDYPKRRVYIMFALLYSVTSVLWAKMSRPWKGHLYFIQKNISLVNFVGVAECLIFFLLFDVGNRTGEWVRIFFASGALCSVYKAMLCFRSVLISAIARDPFRTTEDDPASSIFVHTLMSAYMLSDFHDRMVQAEKLGYHYSFRHMWMHSVPVVLVGTVVLVWTFMALNTLVVGLQERQEDMKAKLFWHSQLLVALSAVGGVLVVCAQLLDPTGAEASSWMRHWLYADGCRQGVFFLLFCGLMVVWRPREEIQGYTYQKVRDIGVTVGAPSYVDGGTSVDDGIGIELRQDLWAPA